MVWKALIPTWLNEGTASYFEGAAILPGSELVLPGVGVNPTRTGLLDVLSCSLDSRPAGPLGEEAADLHPASPVDPPPAFELAGALVPRLIDEIPVLGVLAARSNGVSVIRDAADLRAKESDRIESTAQMLRALGVSVEIRPDGLLIEGCPERPLRGGVTIDACGDHRIAMSAAIAALVADAPVRIEGVDAVETSFPGFLSSLESCIER